MLRYILAAWRPVALATALLALVATPACVQAAGHAGGFHSGGFHSGGFHAGGFHTGGFNYGGYRAGGYRSGYLSGYHNGYGYSNRAYGYYGGYYTPSLYGSAAYISGGDALPPDYYYAPNYTTTAPDYGVSAYYTPDASGPAPAVTAPTAAPESTPGPATVDVYVPASAQVWFDDSPMTQTGNNRQFASPSLAPDRNYTYDIRARWTNNGHVTDETRTITVHANRVTSVDFTQPAPAAAAPNRAASGQREPADEVYQPDHAGRSLRPFPADDRMHR